MSLQIDRWRRSNPIWDLISTLALAALIEVVLRVSGVPARSASRHSIRLYAEEAINKQNKETEALARHAALFWAWIPDSGPPDHHLNEAGFIGPTPTLEPRSGAYRILCLGDSTVANGRDPYPRILQRQLDALQPGRFEVLNAGASGYTALQGLRLLEGRMVHYSPDLVTVQFGWDDQWLSDGPMSARLSHARAPAGARQRLASLGIVQLAERARAGLSSKRPQPGSAIAIGGDSYNVPPDEYREYLERMVGIGRDQGFRVALLTAPSGFDLRNPGPFERLGYRPTNLEPRRRPDDLVATHARLNKIVRDVAGSTGAILIDLDAAFENVTPRDAYFIGDGMHASDKGKELEAQTIAKKLLEEFRMRPEIRTPPPSTANPGHFDIDDARVVLKGFLPMEPAGTDADVFESQVPEKGEIFVLGIRSGYYRTELTFSPRDAGSRLRVSSPGATTEDIAIDPNGHVALLERHAANVHGVVRVTVERLPPGASATVAGAPSLRAVDLLD